MVKWLKVGERNTRAGVKSSDEATKKMGKCGMSKKKRTKTTENRMKRATKCTVAHRAGDCKCILLLMKLERHSFFSVYSHIHTLILVVDSQTDLPHKIDSCSSTAHTTHEITIHKNL